MKIKFSKYANPGVHTAPRFPIITFQPLEP